MAVKVRTNERSHGTFLSDHEEEIGRTYPHADVKSETTLVVPPDGGWGWFVVAASFMCNFLVDGIIFSGGMLSKPIQQEFHVSDKEVAPVNSLLAGFYLMAGPFVSALANKYGFRAVTIIGSFISCAAFALSYFATSVKFLYLSYGILGGLGFCMVYMPAVVIVGFYFERWRALAIGLALCGSGVGTFIMAPLTDKLIENFGWRITVLIHAALVLLCVICGAMFRPIQPIRVTFNNSEEEITENSKRKAYNKLEAEISLPPDKRLIKKIIPRNFSDIFTTRKSNTEDYFQGTTRFGRRASEDCMIKDTVVNKIVATPIPKTKNDILNDSTSNKENGNTELLISSPVKFIPQVAKLRPMSADLSMNLLHRNDVFYGGSLKRLPQYTSRTSLGYHLAISHEEKETSKDTKCHIFPETMRKTLATMLDVSLFRSPTFIILTISGFFTMLGLFVPYMFVKERAEYNGVDKTSSVLLVSTIGIANIFGRVASGLVSSMPQISSLLLYSIALTIGGIATMISGLCYHDAYQFGYCVIFGLSIACFASLRSILVVEYIGLEHLTNCFGLFLLFQGFGALLGSPIAGALIDMTESYDIAFYVSGGFLLVSAMLCYPVDYICRWEKARKLTTLRDA